MNSLMCPQITTTCCCIITNITFVRFFSYKKSKIDSNYRPTKKHFRFFENFPECFIAWCFSKDDDIKEFSQYSHLNGFSTWHCKDVLWDHVSSKTTPGTVDIYVAFHPSEQLLYEYSVNVVHCSRNRIIHTLKGLISEVIWAYIVYRL